MNKWLKITIPLFIIFLLIIVLTYLYLPYPQLPTSPQSVQSIPTFRTLPFDVKWVGRFGGSPDYVTFSLIPNSSAQSNMEYGVQINYRDTGALRTQINAAWSQQDIQSKKQLLIPVKATQDEINNYQLQNAYWDGVNRSTQSQDFSFKYTFKLVSINGKTEQQLVDEQNKQLLQQYQQQLAQYQQKLADRGSQVKNILYVFIPVDIILLVVIIYTGYLIIRKFPLKVSTEPSGAILSVDGLAVGSAPQTLTLSIGNHVIKASLFGYHDVSSTVNIMATSNNPITLILVPEPPKREPVILTPHLHTFPLRDDLFKALEQMDKTHNSYTDEDEANRELTSCLKLMRHDATYHYPLGNGRTIDIFLDDSIVEGKLEPKQSDIDRLIGQIADYIQYRYIIYIVLYGQTDNNLINRINTQIIENLPDRVCLVHLPDPHRIRKN